VFLEKRAGKRKADAIVVSSEDEGDESATTCVAEDLVKLPGSHASTPAVPASSMFGDIVDPHYPHLSRLPIFHQKQSWRMYAEYSRAVDRIFDIKHDIVSMPTFVGADRPGHAVFQSMANDRTQAVLDTLSPSCRLYYYFKKELRKEYALLKRELVKAKSMRAQNPVLYGGLFSAMCKEPTPIKKEPKLKRSRTEY
jgi:hypothetical protein